MPLHTTDDHTGLIEPTYYVFVKILADNSFSASAHAVDPIWDPLTVRSFWQRCAAVGDFIYGLHLIRPKVDHEHDKQARQDARRIQRVAGQLRERIPGAKEACSMGLLMQIGKSIVQKLVCVRRTC
jgi:hypothetical protein